jgi:hypothetical protein
MQTGQNHNEIREHVVNEAPLKRIARWFPGKRRDGLLRNQDAGENHGGHAGEQAQVQTVIDARAD